jgi:cytochrome oxidase assembly protein ShyY1
VPVTDHLRRHQQIIALALMAVIVALGCVALGRWQWHRYQDKHDRKQLVERNYDAAAVPLRDLLPGPDATLDPGLQWRPVRTVGRYDTQATTLVRNRPSDLGGGGPTYGYEVLVPLVLDDGSALLVDRGWLPNGTTGSTPGRAPDTVPVPPAGQVEVVVRLRPGEPRRSEQAPQGQVGSIALDQVAALTGQRLYRAYGVLVSESPAPSSAPAALGRPELDGGEGVNASYAVQWVVFALLALGFPFWYVRRQRALAEGASAPHDDVAVAQPAPGRPGRPVATPRKRRIWDDEDE